MNYIKLPYLDSEVSVFAVCQAHAQLESDYNVGGIVRERPSNTRRNMSTGYQLSRMGYRNPCEWVDILSPDESDDPDADAVRDIYLINVLKWGLPMDDEMTRFVRERFTVDFLRGFGL